MLTKDNCVIVYMNDTQGKVIGLRLSGEIILILDEELINKRRLGKNKSEIIKNILYKWLADEGYIDDTPAVMRLLDQVKELEKEKDRAFLSPDELIKLVEKLKPGEVIEGIAIKK